MALNFSKKNDKDTASDFVVTSIGACIAMPEEKKKDPCVMLAYMAGGSREISFVMVDFLPKNKLHNEDSLLAAIMAAEGVKNITYADAEGRPKDIYFCRPSSGKITDVVDRDYEGNRFKGNIAEIYSGPLKFLIEDEANVVFKSGKKINMKIIGTTDSRYAVDTYEYAAVNAFNACLLGRVFEREELRLETKDKRRVRIEIRTGSSAFVDEGVLYIKPILRDSGDVIDYYLTEEFNYIDGDDVSCRAYKIMYTNRLNDYNLVRV